MSAKEPVISSVAALARAVGVVRPRMSEDVNDPAWPFGPGPWPASDVPRIQAWRTEQHPASPQAKADFDSATSGDMDAAEFVRRMNPERKAKFQYIVEKVTNLRLEREMMLKGYLKKDDVEDGLVRRIHAVKSGLYSLRMRAAELVGKNETEIAAMLTEFADELCRLYSQPP